MLMTRGPDWEALVDDPAAVPAPVLSRCLTEESVACTIVRGGGIIGDLVDAIGLTEEFLRDSSITCGGGG